MERSELNIRKQTPHTSLPFFQSNLDSTQEPLTRVGQGVSSKRKGKFMGMVVFCKECGGRRQFMAKSCPWCGATQEPGEFERALAESEIQFVPKDRDREGELCRL